MTEKSLNSQQTKSDGTEPVSVESALESWKEIAAYLQRDVRTVTRWEKSEGLPVHRHLHRSRSSVYAYPSQLDAWRAGRKPSEEVLPGRKWWGPAHAYAIVLIASLSLISVGTGRWVGAVDASGVPAKNQGPQFRQVMLATALPNAGGKLSPDGKHFAFVSQGSLWIAPVHRNDPSFRTGTPVRLTEPMGAWDDGGVAIVWSGDGNWIAFRAIAPGTRDNPASIYLIPSAGEEPQEVSSNENPLNFWRYCIALSPDGEKLYFADGEGIRTRIYETSVGTNERRPLTGVDTMQPAISPDGTWIAFLTFEAPDGQARRLWTMPVSGGDPSLVCEALPGGFLRSPVWSPDGSRIALLVKSPDNELWECTELWMVPMGSDGRNSGTASRFALPKNTNSLIAGWTAQNEISLLFEGSGISGLYSVPATGGQAVQITDHWSTYPGWSPDGRLIYYRADGDDAYWGLFQIAAEGGSRSEIPFQGEALGIPIPGGGPSLSPDGTRLCFAGVSEGVEDNAFPSAIYVIDSRGGQPVRFASLRLCVFGLDSPEAALHTPSSVPRGLTTASHSKYKGKY